jgi:molecular chaperone GrpE
LFKRTKTYLERMSTKTTDQSTLEKQAADVAEETPVEEQEEAVDEATTELERLREEYAALEDRFLRQAADLQNVRRRALDDRALSLDIGRNQIALPMLDVLDDLRRSLEAADKAVEDEDADALEALHNGVRLVYEKFVAELDRLGIREMDVVGSRFDEDLHDAMMQQPAPDGVEPGTIVGEVQKGYTIGDRVLRHARVVVAS